MRQLDLSTSADNALAVVAADVDGDGDLDALSAAGNTREIAWYQNDGTPQIGTWTRHVIVTLGAGVSLLTTADLDGDGDTDVLSASRGSGNPVVWYENDGTPAVGAWTARTLVPALPDGTESFVSADFDGDGDLDLACAYRSNRSLVWYENDGTPADGAWLGRPVAPTTNGADAVSAIDLDRDGDLDLLAASYFASKVAWYENDGTPLEGAWAEHVISSSAGRPVSVSTGDMDRDGDTDVLSASLDSSATSWYVNDGTPAVGAWTRYNVPPTTHRPFLVVAADLDGDTDADVFAATSPNRLTWQNVQLGTWSVHEIGTGGGTLTSFFAADVNADGDLDLLVASSDDDTIAWYEQRNITNPYDPDSDDDGLLDGFEARWGFNSTAAGEQHQDPDADELTNLEEQTAGTFPHRADSDGDGLGDGAEADLHGTNPTLADHDGDGLPDGFEVEFSLDPRDSDEDDDGRADGLNDPDGDWVANAAEARVGTNPFQADSDGDGLDDREELGWGDFAAQPPISASANGAHSVHAADIDGDGDVDPLSASINDDTIAWYTNTGTGPSFVKRSISTSAGFAVSVYAADVDGDGDIDALAAAQTGGKIAWYENDGTPLTGGWTERVISTSAIGAWSVFAADLDGDGDTDVLSASRYDDTIAWYENDGTPATGGWIERAVSLTADGANSVFAADVDGDGDTDVLSASLEDDTIAWYENDGTPAVGAWAEHGISTAADVATSVFAADMDGDGDMDVLSTSSGDDTIAWYENDGTPSSGPWTEWPISTEAAGAAAAVAVDLNGDGRMDVLSASPDEHTLAWHESAGGPTPTSWTEHPLSNSAWTAVSVYPADLDGDGLTDVLAASTNDNRIHWFRQQWISDPTDPDTDADGLGDGVEIQDIGTDPLVADSDGDGLRDGFEVSYAFNPLVAGEAGQDSDADGLTNLQEQNAGANPRSADSDGDGLGDGAELLTHHSDPARADTDGDGLSDGIEVNSLGTSPTHTDSDGDGLGDYSEVVSVGTSPTLADSDGDGLRDGFELANGFNPRLAGEQGLDPDGDGLTNLQEQAAQTMVHWADTDSDGLRDGFEVTNGFDPLVAGQQGLDTDSDGLTNLAEQTAGTDPRDFDSDDDGLGDGAERDVHGTQPTVADTDGDGLRDGFELENGFAPLVAGDESQDADGDGLSNLEEQSEGTSPIRVDTDRDGLGDGYELANGFGPLDPSEDGNFRVDGQDDFDADGLGNAAEALAGTDPRDADSDDDGLPDGEELGTGNFGSRLAISTLAAGAFSVVAADLDGDGDLDVLAAASLGGVLAWYENGGSPALGPWSEHVITSTADGPVSVVAADLDGDGDTDALSASTGDGVVAWYENDGTPGDGPWSHHTIATAEAGAFSVVAADLDRDGDADVVSAASSGNGVAWYENDGSPALGAWPEHEIANLAIGVRAVFVHDLDHDDEPDVLSASINDNRVVWYANDGTPAQGTWTAQVISGVALGAQSVFATDLDGDGQSDVLSASVNDDTLAWYENDGTGAPTAWLRRAISTSALGAQSVVAADVDGDGDADALSASLSDNTVAWHENQGYPWLGTWPTHTLSNQASGATSVFAADIDGDGDTDALSASFSDGTIAWYEQRNLADPRDPDSDDDGEQDGVEVANGTDPLDPESNGTDSDGDAIADWTDNCPYTANSTQSDLGGVFDEPADGIGDACQCGDVDDDGIVDLSDLDAYRDSLADPLGSSLTPAGVAKCSVIDSAGPCEVLDVVVLARALEPAPLLPGIEQVCSAAIGP